MEKKQKMLFSMQKRSFDGYLDNPGAGLIKIDQVERVPAVQWNIFNLQSDI